jgi:hypothetical protein
MAGSSSGGASASALAVSRSSPVASPFPSRRISPPAGFGVARVMPEISSAFAFTNTACPLAWVRMTGLSGETRLSDACVGKPSTLGLGTASHFSWCQPRPRIQSPGRACFAASATRATISSQFFASASRSCMRALP